MPASVQATVHDVRPATCRVLVALPSCRPPVILCRSCMTGWTPNPRGAGYFFGLDEAQRFKEANGVRMIVRSHELVHKGWAIAGKKDVITVFSSVDYRNTGNDGVMLDATLHSLNRLQSLMSSWRRAAASLCMSG